MNKQQFENLKNIVDNFPDKLARYAYYNKDETCYCAIGVLLSDVGCHVENFNEKQNRLAFESLSYDKETEIFINKINKKFGLNYNDLGELQCVNDHPYYTNEERAIDVKEYLNLLLESKTNNLV